MTFDDSLAGRVEAAVSRGIEKAAIALTNAIKLKLNRSQPYTISKGAAGRWYHGLAPSSPGESPKKLRGDLQRSIAYEMGDDRMSARVGSALPYTAFLELGTSRMAARPFLRSTLTEQAARLADIVNGEVRKVVGG